MNFRRKWERRLSLYLQKLREQEKSRATVEKYAREASRLIAFLGQREPNKQELLRYKEDLIARYSPRGVNCKIAAINSFLHFCGCDNCRLFQVRVQRRAYCDKELELSRSEYTRLVQAARQKNNARLELIIQTLGMTGIRIGELSSLTVEDVRRGEFCVYSKGKVRTVFLAPKLKKRLLSYLKEKGIQTGAVFVTGGGRAVDRSNVWKEMKALCAEANVSSKKVFPHNLRHLFARCFYEEEKDLARLADLLGHSSVETTRIYIVSSGWEHRKILGRLRLLI